jgi:hypothetical protein
VQDVRGPINLLENPKMTNPILDHINRIRFGMMRVVTNPNTPQVTPKLNLSPKLDLPPGFREEVNQWLLDKFGGDPVYYIVPESNPFIPGSMIVCHPANEHLIRQALQSL